MSKPILKIYMGSRFALASTFASKVSPYIRRGAARSHASDVLPFKYDEDLYIFLSRKAITAASATKRMHWFGGRWYNRMSGEEPDYVKLSGVHLRQTLPYCRIEEPDGVVAKGVYTLRLDYVEKAIDAIDQSLK